jgi:hypothetical protein
MFLNIATVFVSFANFVASSDCFCDNSILCSGGRKNIGFTSEDSSPSCSYSSTYKFQYCTPKAVVSVKTFGKCKNRETDGTDGYFYACCQDSLCNDGCTTVHELSNGKGLCFRKSNYALLKMTVAEYENDINTCKPGYGWTPDVNGYHCDSMCSAGNSIVNLNIK